MDVLSSVLNNSVTFGSYMYNYCPILPATGLPSSNWATTQATIAHKYKVRNIKKYLNLLGLERNQIFH